MKSNYIVRRLNSLFDDSAIFVRNIYFKKALLFDCGRLGNIENSEVNDISHVFISHTHIDHFNGFDRFLRTALLSGKKITFCGPSGFINNLKGKLASYTWNLIYDYDVTFLAVEITENGFKGAEFSTKNGFKEEKVTVNSNAILDDGFLLEYEFFDHGIISLGYRVKEPKRISINKNKLANNGFKEGSWIKILKDAILSNNSNDIIDVDTNNGIKQCYIYELAEKIVDYPVAQDITYITDIAPTFANYKKAVNFAKDSHILLIESVFMNQDILDAIKKQHLSIGLSKAIYKYSNSYFVSFGHFSPRYDRIKNIFAKELYKGINSKKIIKLELNR